VRVSVQTIFFNVVIRTWQMVPYANRYTSQIDGTTGVILFRHPVFPNFWKARVGVVSMCNIEKISTIREKPHVKSRQHSFQVSLSIHYLTPVKIMDYFFLYILIYCTIALLLDFTRVYLWLCITLWPVHRFDCNSALYNKQLHFGA